MASLKNEQLDQIASMIRSVQALETERRVEADEGQFAAVVFASGIELYMADEGLIGKLVDQGDETWEFQPSK